MIANESLLAAAEENGTRLSRIASDLVAEASVTGPAEERLGRLLALQDRVLDGTDSLDDAAGVLARLHDLRDGLRDAAGTVSGVQHMIVDVMLLQPAVDRAVAALKPVIELTRTARQADPATMAPRPVAERAAEPAPEAPRPTATAPVVGTAPSTEAVK